MRRCLLARCAAIAACTVERYPGDEIGVYARGGMALDSVSFDQGVAVVHLLLAALQVRVWFEYVESAANWSDGVSRELEKDPWAQANGFPVAIAEVPLWPWTVEADYRTQRVLQEVSESA